MRRSLIYLFFLFSTSSGSFAQRISAEQYIERYKEIAMAEMKRSGIPASITLAQGLLESESGNGDLTLRSNNHFGIKCKTGWMGESVSHDDDEQGECFRKYNTPEESYRDHTDFLTSGARYAFLFSIKPQDYKAWAYGLKKAGYATNPRYPEMLIRSIEKYNLQQYTLLTISNSSTPAADSLAASAKGQSDGIGLHTSSSQENNRIDENDKIKIPQDVSPKPEVSEEAVIHEVQPKEGLYGIARKYNVSINDIKSTNNLSSTQLRIGQKLIIPNK